jgi:hypothetical protein
MAISFFSRQVARWNRFNTRLDRSYLGRQLKVGTKEAFGHYYEGFGSGAQSYGFLGMKGALGDIRAKGFRAGMSGKWGRLAGGTLSIAGTASLAYEGYKEGGVFGAAKGIGTSVAWNWGTRAAVGVIGAPVTAALAVGTAAAIGTYAVGEAARKHVKSLGQLEFGSNNMMDVIGSAGAATSRQRSVMALQNTHLNGRMALGNEAVLMHTSFR